MISEWPIHALQTWEGKSLPALNRPPRPISDNHSVGNKFHGKVPHIRKSEPCPNFLVMNVPKWPPPRLCRWCIETLPSDIFPGRIGIGAEDVSGHISVNGPVVGRRDVAGRCSTRLPRGFRMASRNGKSSSSFGLPSSITVAQQALWRRLGSGILMSRRPGVDQRYSPSP